MQALIVITVVFILLYSLVMYVTGKPVKRNELVYPFQERILKCQEPEKKVLYIYQPSSHGSVEKAAEYFAGRLKNSHCEVCMNRPSPELAYDLDAYDIIFLSSAVYLGLPSLVLQKYIEQHSFAGKKVVILLIGRRMDVTEELELLADRMEDAAGICRIKVSKDEYETAWETISAFIKEAEE